jgi:hypothetical protein
VLFGLAALGLSVLSKSTTSRKEKLAWSVLLLLLSAYGWFDAKLAIYYGAAVFLVALWAGWSLLGKFGEGEVPQAAFLLIALSAGLIIAGEQPSPVLRTLGTEAKEQAVVYLNAHLKAGSKVAAGAPGVPWASKMEFANLSAPDVPVGRTPDHFIDWLVSQNVQMIYVDHNLYNSNPTVWDLLKPEIGGRLERVFVADEGDVQILTFRKAP